VSRRSRNDLVRAVLSATLLVRGALAQAQSPGGSPPDSSHALDEVVVTGSRIPVSVRDAIVPITVLDATDLARGGSDSLAKTLQMLPASASSVLNTNVNNLGPAGSTATGVARVDLRALQPKRTLVLLNGHRLAAGGIGGDDAVDINSLPVALIDHVEVLTGGASAVYGADAVAGVVNFITKSAFNGFEVNAEQSAAYRGDGAITNLSLNAGREIWGGQWLVGAAYVNQRGVGQTSRGFSASPVTFGDANGDFVSNGSGALPEGLFFVPDGNRLGLDEGIYTHVSGVQGRTAADYRLGDVNLDRFNYRPYEYLQTPNQRSSAWLLGTQPLSDRLSLHLEGMFNRRTSSQRLAPNPYDSSFDPAPVLADGTVGIPANNYYNPFGEDLTVRRRLVELGDRSYYQTVDVHRELVSLRIEAAGWTIEPAFSYSGSRGSQTDTAAIPGQLIATAVGPSGPNAQGQIVCGTPATSGIVPASAVIPGCVPVDLFGGVGSLTPAMIASLQRSLTDHGTDSERIAGFTARGPWGRAPGGPVQWAVGAEYRRDVGSYLYDPAGGSGPVGSGGVQDIPAVSVATRETYVEARAPLVNEHPLVQALDATAGLRYSNFSSFGSHFTWEAGLHWQPLSAVSLRGSYSKVFRAPSLQELYRVPGVGADIEIDPCGNSPTPAQQAHCAANGVPGGAYEQSPYLTFNTRTGGNPALAAERGYSFDAGLDFRPPGLPGFSTTLDLYQVSLNGYIEIPGIADILQQCADGGRADICGLISRTADGSVVSVQDQPRNFGSTVVRGVDGALSWASDLQYGRLKWVLQGSYLARHDTQLFPGGDTQAQAGTYSTYAAALPRWRALTHLDFDHGPWHLSYSAQYIGAYQECGYVDFQDALFCRRVESVFYHDAEAAFGLHSGLTLRLGVNNLTNRQPPYLNFGNDANTDTSTYRLVGRTVFAGIRYRSR
jgi:iron complex outermembrane recepter protein